MVRIRMKAYDALVLLDGAGYEIDSEEKKKILSSLGIERIDEIVDYSGQAPRLKGRVKIRKRPCKDPERSEKLKLSANIVLMILHLRLEKGMSFVAIGRKLGIPWLLVKETLELYERL